ncbi:glycosyltransferase family 2 protein, partial [Patescibacteria group bacterium]|nr:glycosyltransferase family 2 protein [Patescibacteria group bacterium]
MSKANNRLVSIVVPVYNAASFIDETIKTVLDQTYTNWELLLVDDKSTDKSVKLIKPYLTKDKRIKLLSNKKNSGAAISRNKGIDAAKGRYIAFLDADDLWLPTKLEKQVAFMQKQDCAFGFTGYEF